MSQPVPPGWYPDTDDPTAERWWEGNSWSDQRRPRGAVTIAHRPSIVIDRTEDGIRSASTAVTIGYVGLWFCIAATMFSVLGAGFTALAWMLIIGLGLFTPIATVIGIVAIILAARAFGMIPPGPDRQPARTALILGILSTATGIIALVLCIPLGLLFHYLGALVQRPS